VVIVHVGRTTTKLFSIWTPPPVENSPDSRAYREINKIEKCHKVIKTRCSTDEDFDRFPGLIWIDAAYERSS
jgi:hypothetical protein